MRWFFEQLIKIFGLSLTVCLLLVVPTGVIGLALGFLQIVGILHTGFTILWLLMPLIILLAFNAIVAVWCAILKTEQERNA
jgi:hypothetical protein